MGITVRLDTNLRNGLNGMKILVTANNTNGNLPRLEEWFDTVESAKKHADWWHTHSSLCNVEITEPLGVMLTYANGSKVFEVAEDLGEALDVANSWKSVVANKKVNRTRVRKVEILGAADKTAVSTPEDSLIGKWAADALDDPKIPPSMKYDINRWMDSKEWV